MPVGKRWRCFPRASLNFYPASRGSPLAAPIYDLCPSSGRICDRPIIQLITAILRSWSDCPGEIITQLGGLPEEKKSVAANSPRSKHKGWIKLEDFFFKLTFIQPLANNLGDFDSFLEQTGYFVECREEICFPMATRLTIFRFNFNFAVACCRPSWSIGLWFKSPPKS